MRDAVTRLFKNMRSRAVADYCRCILKCLEPSQEEMSLLDCGCDDGEWTLQLGARIGAARLCGIEIVDERRQAALQKGILAKPGDLNEPFPFGDEQFEIVHANQVIEHLKETDSFIQEIWRTLRPGGYAVICTENLSSWHNIVSLVFGWQPFSLTNVSGKRFQIGNPLAETATVELRVRRLDLPPDWMVTVSPAAVELGPGEEVTGLLGIRPGLAAVQGTQPRVAVEGYVDGELIGGVVTEVMVPRHVLGGPKQKVYLPLVIKGYTRGH